MKTRSKKNKKLWKWRQKLYQGLIEKGTLVEVNFIDPLPKGDGDIKSVTGRVIQQKHYFFYVSGQYSNNVVRIRKNQMFSILSGKRVRVPHLSHVHKGGTE